MERVLITGANGMLGSSLCPELKRQNYQIYPTDIDISNGNIEYLDIRDKKQIDLFVETYHPDLIFHLAAETDVDRCEREKEHPHAVNVEGTKNIARICQKEDITMVYVSTSGVFDGYKKQPYTELDEPNPINAYARTKLEGEGIVRDLLSRYFIVRAGWMFGGGRKDKKFIGKIVKLLKSKKEIKVVNDKFGSPTFTEDLSRGMIELVQTKRYGLYHIANQGWCSRYDIACKIAEFLELKDVVIEPVSSKVFNLDAKRGNSEMMDSSKVRFLGIYVRPWEEALKEYLMRFRE